MTKIEVEFKGDEIWIGKFKIEKSSLGWHLLKDNGDLVVAVSDVEDAVVIAKGRIEKELRGG
ncbi:TPA: hypothetical protein PVK60_000558 [Acinetobacter baumannii]|uniref:hypothetical protein n=1 Tax=Acinetobacter baumannii TaxID=470 RepID=UPI00190174FC|nr:hypothetical protein [Acinetobacter baumannii]MBJ9388235.1 hypothetical protein [Acinetobacter baumannii]MBJ9432293.1 hypothetical protein [Acinetobacter baumannii]MDO7225157.1 hypothetical protein [Acinetobacter baumannii]HDI1577327.1 hypothetical protein [Acinetobacter baumannii]HDK8957557.1 hypothetical protein [Acinetobacter baumannii]